MALARIPLLIKELMNEFATFRLATVGQDLRYSIRHLARNPSFFITAVLTQGLGISASCAVFTVAYGVLIYPFPYKALPLALIAFPVSLVGAFDELQAILRIVPTDTIPDEAVITMNVPALLASLGIALGTVRIFGTMPAWHSARPRLAAALNSLRSSDSRTRRRLLSGFIVSEIALSLALLMLAGLMVRSIVAVESVPVPFTPDRTLMLRIPLADTRYPTGSCWVACSLSQA